jgi:hypothetical protein
MGDRRVSGHLMRRRSAHISTVRFLFSLGKGYASQGGREFWLGVWKKFGGNRGGLGSTSVMGMPINRLFRKTAAVFVRCTIRGRLHSDDHH